MTSTPTPFPDEVMELAREAMLSYFRDRRTPVSVKMVAGYKNEPLEEAIARAIMVDRARRSDPATAEVARLREAGRKAGLNEAASLLEEKAQDYNRIRDPGMANHCRAYARRIRALGEA